MTRPDSEPVMVAANDYAQLEDLAYHDSLTGLPNRAALIDGIDSAIAEKTEDEGVALIFVDLDGLKIVNDTEGHAAGNVLLQTAAKSLSVNRRHDSQDRPGDLIGHDTFRLSGDEFVMLLRGVKSEEDVQKFIERSQDNLAKDGIKASMGGRMHRGNEKADDLLHDVDQLMYAKKQQRKAEEAARLAEQEQERIGQLPRRKRAAHVLSRVALRTAAGLVQYRDK